MQKYRAEMYVMVFPYNYDDIISSRVHPSAVWFYITIIWWYNDIYMLITVESFYMQHATYDFFGYKRVEQLCMI